RLLVLLLSFRYSLSARRIIVYAELACLAVMTLIVGVYYQYLSHLCNLFNGIGTLQACLYCQNTWWRARFQVMIVLKAFIGVLNTLNCAMFFYQVRKIRQLKV
ncbi:hypothetical protein AAVH_43443, partial [Aphelenchoides avenae]